MRCQRCELPVCSTCQRTAAVGVQCVDCVKQQAAQHPTVRSTMGGVAAPGPPVLTIGLIAVTVLLYLVQVVSPGFTNMMSFVPAWTSQEPWRMVTSGFVHSPQSPLHIAFNMYALYITGVSLEPLLGRARFLALYLVTMLAGSAAFAVIAGSITTDAAGQASLTAAVGASGAVFGLFGALLIIGRRLGNNMTQLVVLLVINAAIGFIWPNIAWEAHLGGFLAGVIIAAVLSYVPNARRAPWMFWVTCAVLAVVSVTAAYVVSVSAMSAIGV